MNSVNTLPPLAKGTDKFLNYLTTSVKTFKNTMAIAEQRRTIANNYGKDIRTIIRYLEELESKGYIQTLTRRGSKGGTVIVYTKEFMNFHVPEGRNLEDVLRPEDILDEAFPKKTKKQPKRKYRSKEEIAKERAKDAHIASLNDELEQMDYPTKEFWFKLDDPELSYRAWILSRMYNFYAVAYPERWKYEYEAEGDWARFELARIRQDNLQNYDCLPKRFLGTWQMTVFKKLVKIIDSYKIMEPQEYLSIPFRYMEYLWHQGKTNVSLPYINTLISEETVDRVLQAYGHRKAHLREHPYYDNGAPLLGSGVGLFILNSTMITEYNSPFREIDFGGMIEKKYNPLATPKHLKLLHTYRLTVMEELEENTELTEEEKTTLLKWLDKETYFRLQARPVPYHHLIMNVDTLTKKVSKFVRAGNFDNWRPLYEQLGNQTLIPVQDQLELKTRTKHGYSILFSLTATPQQQKVVRAIRSALGMEIDTDVLASAIRKLGEEKVPMTEFGELDGMAIMERAIPREQITSLELENAHVIRDEEHKKALFSGEYFFQVEERAIGESKRDGKRVFIRNGGY